MSDATLPALRVVLAVSEVAQITSLRTTAVLWRKAYHFQQSMRRFSEECLRDINALLRTPTHRLIMIPSPDCDPEDDFLIFVSPDLGEESYVLYDETVVIPMSDLGALANLMAVWPEVCEGYMSICFSGHNRSYDFDTPDTGIALVAVE